MSLSYGYGVSRDTPATGILAEMYHSPQQYNEGLLAFHYPLYEASDEELDYFLGSLVHSVGKAVGGVAKTVGSVAKTAGKALSSVEKVIPSQVLTAGLNWTPMGMAVRAGMGALTAAADGKNVFQSAMRSMAADPVTRFYVDTGMAAARGENLLKAAQKAAQAGIGDLKQSLQFAAMVAPFIPGLGTGVAAALGAANALAAGQPITEALIAAARSALPGGAVAQMAFDTVMNVARGKNFGDALLNSARSQLPGGPAAQAAFDAGLALAKGKSIQDAAFAAAGKLLPPSPYAADALTFVKKVAAGENIQKAALSSLGNLVMSRIEHMTGPVLSNVGPRIQQLPGVFRAPAIRNGVRLPFTPPNLRRESGIMQHEITAAYGATPEGQRQFQPNRYAGFGPGQLSTRWRQVPNGQLWLPSRSIESTNDQYETGSSAQPDSRAVRITVIGHASARWLGARNQADADRLNLQLSNKRADNVRGAVEQILKQEIPGVAIAPGSSLAPGQHPTGVQVGSYGVGSRKPVLNPAPAKIDPNEDNPVNRSVVVLLEMTTTKYSSAGVSRAPLRVNARTRFWYGQVMAFEGTALAVAAYYLRLAIRNSLSNKVVNYSGYLFGGGASSKVSLPSHPKPGSVGDEFSFYTEKEMGFDDFDSQWVRIEKLSAALGIKATVAYLTFVGLGSGASMRAFQKGFGLGKASLDAAVVSGKLNMEGHNPGDWFEVDGGTDTVPVTSDAVRNDGLTLTFPTGKAGLTDLKLEDRKKLENFVVSWARQIR